MVDQHASTISNSATVPALALVVVFQDAKNEHAQSLRFIVRRARTHCIAAHTMVQRAATISNSAIVPALAFVVVLQGVLCGYQGQILGPAPSGGLEAERPSSQELDLASLPERPLPGPLSRPPPRNNYRQGRAPPPSKDVTSVSMSGA